MGVASIGSGRDQVEDVGDVFHRVPWGLGGVARSADPGQGFVRVCGVYVLHGDTGMDVEEADEVDRIGGLPGLVQDAVGPYLPWQQPDLVERGPHRAIADLRRVGVPVGLVDWGQRRRSRSQSAARSVLRSSR